MGGLDTTEKSFKELQNKLTGIQTHLGKEEIFF